MSPYGLAFLITTLCHNSSIFSPFHCSLYSILNVRILGLAVAFAFWAVATFLDLSYLMLPFYYPRWVYLAKDILKLFGIVGWTTYFVMAGIDAIHAANAQRDCKQNHA